VLGDVVVDAFAIRLRRQRFVSSICRWRRNVRRRRGPVLSLLSGIQVFGSRMFGFLFGVEVIEIAVRIHRTRGWSQTFRPGRRDGSWPNGRGVNRDFEQPAIVRDLPPAYVFGARQTDFGQSGSQSMLAHDEKLARPAVQLWLA